jgi:hypothetical protein
MLLHQRAGVIQTGAQDGIGLHFRSALHDAAGIP